MIFIRRKIYVQFLILCLVLIAFVSITLSWVSEAKKAKTEIDDLVVSTTDELLISLNGGATWNNTLSVRDANHSAIANLINNMKLTDCTGDGINLYSATIDPYSRLPQTLGWQIQKSVGSNTEEAVTRNENKTYYLINVRFRSTVALNVFASDSSYVRPSTTRITSSQALFLKRTAVTNEQTTTYVYTDENGQVRPSTTRVYNESLYSLSYDDSGEAVQTKYSANFIAGAVRVAYINNSYSDDYLQVSDYANTKLRMIWAPNPSYKITRTYTADSDTYTFDIDNRDSDPDSNAYYRIDHTTFTQIGNLSRFPNEIFKENLLPHTQENAANQRILAILSYNDLTGFYEAEIQIVVWIEGADNECVKALTAGNGYGVSEVDESTLGSSRISFCFSFYGEEV